MRLLFGLALGVAGGLVVWGAAAEVFRQPRFARRNYRGVDVPVGAGLVLAIVAIGVEAALSLLDTVDRTVAADRSARLLTLAVVVGFSLLGLVDDLAATGDDRGFRGHLQALAHGRLTTGGLKLVGGGLLSLVAASWAGQRSIGRVILGALVISFAANLGNLFDRAPGRTIKAGVLAALPLFVLAGATDRDQLTGVAVVIGAAIGLLAFDLREQLMLGDAGSNVVGAVLGLGVVLTTGFWVWVAAAVVLAALNLASERVSFSQVIDSVGLLRFLDGLGRRRPD